jgi:hypothetical protein
VTPRASRLRRRAAEAGLLAVAVLQRALTSRPAPALGPAGLEALAAAAPHALVPAQASPSGRGHLTLVVADRAALVRGLREQGWRVRARPAPALSPRNRRLVLAWARSGLRVRSGALAWRTLAGGTGRVLLDVERTGAPTARVLVTEVAEPVADLGSTGPDPALDGTAPDVDAVITWVDDTDPAWRASLAAAGGDAVADESRWRDRGEGGLCLDSILSRMPWIRHVHVLTAGQVPEWLGEDPRVHLVDHREVFPDSSVLPTFNSHAIEACLHLIPGLAERFVYFNDDVIVLAPLGPLDFHDADGRPVVSLSLPIPEDRGGETAWWAAAGAAAALTDAELGFAPRRMLAHAPYPLTRAAMLDAEAAHPEVFARVRASRLRSTTDVAPVALSLQRALQRGRAVAGGPLTLDLQPASAADAAAGVELIARLAPPVVCVNDGGWPGDPVAPVLDEVRRILAVPPGMMTP